MIDSISLKRKLISPTLESNTSVDLVNSVDQGLFSR